VPEKARFSQAPAPDRGVWAQRGLTRSCFINVLDSDRSDCARNSNQGNSHTGLGDLDPNVAIIGGEESTDDNDHDSE
jgi:hypothetical protein